MMIVQGDIYFIKKKLPRRVRKIDHNGLLKQGEVTGHCHRVAEADLDNLDFYEDSEGVLWLKVNKEVVVVHEEHFPVVLEPGEYWMDSQIEDNAFGEEIREIKD